MDDLFTKIIKGEVPSVKVYEDKNTFAFLDIDPVNKGHTLVVPKKSYRNVLDINKEEWCLLMETVRKIAVAVKKATGANGINIYMNNEASADQKVFHAHVHIIPRFEGDNKITPAKHVDYAEGEDEKYGEMIRTEL